MFLLMSVFALCAGCILLSAWHPAFLVAALLSLGLLLALALRFLRQSRTDALTRVYNLRCLTVKAAAYARSPQLLVHYFDVDHLKQVNDTQGHSAGDLLLQETAAALRRAGGNNGEVYRLGGDEFLLIFQGCAAELPWEEVCPAASHGFAQGPGETLQMLIRSAEQEMYVAKGQRAQSSPEGSSH